MKKREKRFEEHKEHKSRGKEIVISPQDILNALNKLTEFLPVSGPEELTLAKTKVIAEKEKIKQEIEKDVQKAKKIAQLVREIEGINEKIIHLPEKEKQDLRLSLQKTKPTRSDIQKMEAIIKKKQDEFHKELAEKQEELQTLRNPSFKPLEPSEMASALIYSPYRPNSLDEVLVKLHGLTAESSAQELIDTVNSLISPARIEPLKSKIDSRKDFLKTTKGKLPLVTKLPNKPGDEGNIGGFISSIRNLHGAFVAEQEINDQRIHFLQKSANLLITLRGYLKIWGDPKLMPETGTIDFSKDGMIGFLELLLINLEEIVKNVSFLVKDFSLLYDFVEPDQNSPQNLMQLLKNHQKFLYQQKESNHKKFLKAQDFYDLGFVREEDGSVKRKGITLQVERGELRKSGHEDLSKKNSDLLEQYKEVLEEIINSCFNESSLPSKPPLTRNTSKYTKESSLASIVMGNLDPEELPLNISKALEYLINSSLGKAKYYSEQLKYTDTAITSLTKMQIEYITAKKFESSLFSNIYQAIGDVFEESIISIIKEYAYLSSSESLSTAYEYNESEESYYNKILEINKNIKFLAKAQNAIKFCYYLRTSGKVSELQEFLFNLNFINIELSFSNGFTKLMNGKLSAVLFIDQMIKVATRIIGFFDFNTVKKLGTDEQLKIAVVKKIEDYLVKDLSLVIKSLVGRTIEQEHSLLDSFGYFIDHLDAEGTKNIKVPELLNMLIRLADCNPAVSKQLFNAKILDDLVKRALFEKDNISKVLYDLIRSGHADTEIIDQFLKAGVDINFVYNGKGYLHLTASQLTEVGREHQLNYKKEYDIPYVQQYKIDPNEQDKLIETALFLVEKGADINLKNLYLIFLRDENILKQLSLEDCDVYGRNLLHLLFRDMFDFFYGSSDKPSAKSEFISSLFSIVRSMKAGQEDMVDKEGNTAGHYLASSITEEYLKTKDSHGHENRFPAVAFNLNIKNHYGENPLHVAFSKTGDPFAFYEFALSKFCPVVGWHHVGLLDLHTKNKQGKSVLDLVIKSGSKMIASTINTYMGAIVFELGKTDDEIFYNLQTARQVVDDFLKKKQEVPSDEIEQTIYLQKMYDYAKDSSSSCSSSSSSSSSSMPSYSISSSSSSGSMSYSSSSTSSSSISEVALGSDGEITTIMGRNTRAGTELLWHPVPSDIDTIPLEQFLSGDSDSILDH
ncbi:Ankyrin repeat domain-containing protein [Candidatus Megaera polyxenophila]|nr:Ankyrin repeat domain-containing protein [Candidatus Megaera polyxenophila]